MAKICQKSDIIPHSNYIYKIANNGERITMSSIIFAENQNSTGGQLSSFHENVIQFIENYNDPLDEEKQFFLSIRNELKNDPNYRNKYVAILNKKIVGSGDNGAELAIRLYKKHGYIPIFIEKVDEDIIYTNSPKIK